MQKIPKTYACDFVIFGTKGDLANRKLLPSLYHLEKAGLIHSETRIIGVGRANWNVSRYIKKVRESLDNFILEPIHENSWKIMRERLEFCNLDVNEIKDFERLKKKIGQRNRNIINYFAIPPSTFGNICKGLGRYGLNTRSSCIVMEKPLGTNLESSRLINQQVERYFNENQIYRMDHYLGKETILNLFALRFANSFFDNNWNSRMIDHVQITVSEDIGIGDRWKYFDKIGQTRDMIQSHLLQILSIVAMSPPIRFTADHIRDEKVKVLRALQVIDSRNVERKTVIGQYTSGFIHGKKVPGYLEEKGSNQNSLTETFVAMRVDIDNQRWNGSPFYLRTGKRLSSKYSEVVIYFKKPLVNLFHTSQSDLFENKLTIRLQTNEGIDIQILNKKPGIDYDYKLRINNLKLSFIKESDQMYLINPYERLLLSIMRGIQTLFVRKDEVEESWKWIDSIMESWKLKKKSIVFYQAGSIGPIDSIHLIRKDGRSWNITK